MAPRLLQWRARAGLKPCATGAGDETRGAEALRHGSNQMASTTSIQAGNWLTQMSQSARAALDGNRDGLIDRNELGSFLATLTDAVGGESPTAYGVRSGVANALVTQTRPIDTRASTTAGDRGVVSHQAWSWSPAGEKVTFSYQLPADYRYEQGAFRHVMPGFIHDRMPNWQDDTALKYIFARAAEHIDPQQPGAIDQVVKRLGEMGISVEKRADDVLYFTHTGEEIDVLRGARNGPTPSGYDHWQWLELNEGDLEAAARATAARAEAASNAQSAANSAVSSPVATGAAAVAAAAARGLPQVAAADATRLVQAAETLAKLMVESNFAAGATARTATSELFREDGSTSA